MLCNAIVCIRYLESFFMGNVAVDEADHAFVFRKDCRLLRFGSYSRSIRFLRNIFKSD
jgi:hypothetical protein